MPSSETLRVRVDKETAKLVKAYAKAHGTDVSGTLRKALERLLDETERARKREEIRRKLDDLERQGFFEPPKDDSWKASGGWR